MAYATQMQSNYFKSWDNKTEIVQENQLVKGKKQVRINVSNQAYKINKSTDWLDCPLEDNKTISDIVLELVPNFRQSQDFLPLIETTSSRRKYDMLCSSYVLKDKSKYKMYVPISETLTNYEIMRTRPSKFQLSNGSRVRNVSPVEVIEIIEE